MSQPPWLRIDGARQNNLKNVSVAIPHDRVTVITGVSGSGKSSLAFDTLFAEGQWRYIESLSTYARMFLERLDRPDVDNIEHIGRPSPSSRRTPCAAPARQCAPPREIDVLNRSDHTILVSSHSPFFEVNRRLVFDRALAWGMHLDVPAGKSVRWRPGESVRVRLVAFGGRGVLVGFNRLSEGPASPGLRASRGARA